MVAVKLNPRTLSKILWFKKYRWDAERFEETVEETFDELTAVLVPRHRVFLLSGDGEPVDMHAKSFGANGFLPVEESAQAEGDVQVPKAAEGPDGEPEEDHPQETGDEHQPGSAPHITSIFGAGVKDWTAHEVPVDGPVQISMSPPESSEMADPEELETPTRVVYKDPKTGNSKGKGKRSPPSEGPSSEESAPPASKRAKPDSKDVVGEAPDPWHVVEMSRRQYNGRSAPKPKIENGERVKVVAIERLQAPKGIPPGRYTLRIEYDQMPTADGSHVTRRGTRWDPCYVEAPIYIENDPGVLENGSTVPSLPPCKCDASAIVLVGEPFRLTLPSATSARGG